MATEIATVNNVDFIWITDGDGWNSARNNLEETFEVMDMIYNINDLDNGVLKDLK